MFSLLLLCVWSFSYNLYNQADRLKINFSVPQYIILFIAVVGIINIEVVVIVTDTVTRTITFWLKSYGLKYYDYYSTTYCYGVKHLNVYVHL